jgi:hypothetical protein
MEIRLDVLALPKSPASHHGQWGISGNASRMDEIPDIHYLMSVVQGGFRQALRSALGNGRHLLTTKGEGLLTSDLVNRYPATANDWPQPGPARHIHFPRKAVGNPCL